MSDLFEDGQSQPFDITEAVPADHEDCARVFEAGWNQAMPRQTRKIGEQEFAELTRGEHILVARLKQQLVGFCSVWLPDAFVHHLYVSPQAQGLGVGKALLAHQHANLDSQPLTLKCQTANTSAIHFYQRLGFQPNGDAGIDEYGRWVGLQVG